MGLGERTLTLLAGGDIAPVEGPTEPLVELILPTLTGADFRLAQCERTYSRRGAYPDWQLTPGGRWTRLDPELASIYDHARIDVVSVASNHAMDWGYEALEDTIQLLESKGLTVIGGGQNSERARRPAYIAKDGVRVAVLAYTSVLRDGQSAAADHPGLAAIRARTWYEPIDYQPGSPPLVMSAPLEQDLEKLDSDVRAAKEQSDAVVMFIHWGLRHVPKVLAAYQTTLARRAIDAGVDVVIGHHPHVPKAIEVYRGKVCFYSIGNFITTGRLIEKAKSRAEWNVFWYDPNWDEGSRYRFPRDGQRILLPRITFGPGGIERVAVLLGRVNRFAQPYVLTADDPLFEDALTYLEWVSDDVPHAFEVEGDEVVIRGTPSDHVASPGNEGTDS